MIHKFRIAKKNLMSSIMKKLTKKEKSFLVELFMMEDPTFQKFEITRWDIENEEFFFHVQRHSNETNETFDEYFRLIAKEEFGKRINLHKDFKDGS